MTRLFLYCCVITAALVNHAAADGCDESQSNLYGALCTVLEEAAKGDRPEQYCKTLRRVTTPSPEPSEKCAIALALYQLGRSGEIASLGLASASQCPPVMSSGDWTRILSAKPNAMLSIELNFPAGHLDSLRVVDLTKSTSRMVYCSSIEPGHPRNKQDFDSSHIEVTVPEYGEYRLEAQWKHGGRTKHVVTFERNGERNDSLDFGLVRLTNVPESAQVAVDGELQQADNKPPAVLVLRANQEHTLMITASGYHPYTAPVTVSTQQLDLPVALNRLEDTDSSAEPRPRWIGFGARAELAVHGDPGVAGGINVSASHTLTGHVQAQLGVAARFAAHATFVGGGAGLRWAIAGHIAVGAAMEVFYVHVTIADPATRTVALHPELEALWHPFEVPVYLSFAVGYYAFPVAEAADVGSGFGTLALGAGWSLFP